MKKSTLHILMLIGIFSLISCGERTSDKEARKWNEQEEQRKAEIEALKTNTADARAEMIYCQSNREKIISTANILLTENRASESLENVHKCFYWLSNDVEFSTTVKKALGKLGQTRLSEIPKNRHEERLFAIRGILLSDPSLRSSYAAELAKLEEIEKSNLKKEKMANAMAKKREGVRIGMTPEDVLASQWGKPNRINRTTTSFGTREQWVYSGGYLYFENGKLEAVQN